MVVPASAGAREKPQPRRAPKELSRRKSRIERQALPATMLAKMIEGLPRVCDTGCKTNSKRGKEWWVGYKLRLNVADGEVPLNFILNLRLAA